MKTTIDGLSSHWEEHGRGEPVLLVHGFPLSGELWKEVVPLLEAEYRLIVPDLRGHGRSGGSHEVTMARFADDLAALLDEVVGGPVTLAGLSMGGYIGLELCRRHPERVRALVLANTRAQADTPESVRTRHETAARVLEEGSVVVADIMTERLFGPRAPAALREEWHAIMAATRPESVAASLRGMAKRPDAFDVLARLEVPVLVIVGEHDDLTPVPDAERMHAAARDARLEVIAGVGHMTPVEAPVEFAAILRGFLEEVLPRA